jgi:hypothetical protein
MAAAEEKWHPASFTKNFGWGEEAEGLVGLYECIRRGFAGAMQDVPRQDFRERNKELGDKVLVPINFFLFNKIVNGTEYIIVDELVFQALTAEHSPHFDKLALFTFNFSYAGAWKEAYDYQRRPALWAFHYIKERAIEQFNWDVNAVDAADIQQYVSSDPRYMGRTARKLATNLNFLYTKGRLREFADPRVDRWWVDAVFLALDRLVEDRKLDGRETSPAQYAALLSEAGFHTISGRRSLEKDLATAHVLRLYTACGGLDRFCDERAWERTAREAPDEACPAPNDQRPHGAVHPTNPRILKTIPRLCAELARRAGFKIIDADELASFDIAEFIRREMDGALASLRKQNAVPTMTAQELVRMMRD